MGSKPRYISASRGAAILGLNEWQSQVDVWLTIMEEREPGFCAKYGYKTPTDENNASMSWGLTFEDSICDIAEIKNNRQIVDREKYDDHVQYDFITCHIDGRLKYENILHEGKTTWWKYFRNNFGEPGTDKVPIQYQIQCQHQMMCTDADQVILSVLVFPRTPDSWEEKNINPADIGSISDWAQVLDEMDYFHQYYIERNNELIKKMTEKYVDFWENNILNNEAPVPVKHDDILALCPAPVGTILADEQVERWVAEYNEITKEIGTTSPLYIRKEQLKVLILNYMKKYNEQNKVFVDEDSAKKWILKNNQGRKIASYNGKIFRA